MKFFSLSFLMLCLCTTTRAQTPTWSSDIASIIYNNCSSCHRSGGIGPFPLMSYQDAVNHAMAISAAVTSKNMPPWKPDPGYRHLKDERYLKDAEILKIQQWVAASTPSGNLANAPQPPTFPSGSQMQNIDRTVSTLKYTVPVNTDVYRTYVIHSNYTTDKYLNEIEFVPGNNAVVHHIILYQDPTTFSDSVDKADPAPGFASNGTEQPSPSVKYICVWAPGAGTYKLPDNMGMRIPAGADYLIEVHYAPGSSGQSDSTLINLKYATGPNVRPVFVDAVMDWAPGSRINPILFLPANQVTTRKQRFINDVTDYSVISVFPHMHKIGQSYKIFTTNSSGVDTTPYVYIPDWDFHWQGFYTFQKIQKLALNEQLWGVVVYNNTSSNPDNPNTPPKNVFWGEKTTDEMMVTFLAYTFYQAGDENIVLDSAGIKADVPKIKQVNPMAAIYPNPVADELTISWRLPSNPVAEKALYSLCDMYGKEIIAGPIINEHTEVQTGELAAGVYFITITSDTRRQVLRLVKE